MGASSDRNRTGVICRAANQIQSRPRAQVRDQQGVVGTVLLSRVPPANSHVGANRRLMPPDRVNVKGVVCAASGHHPGRQSCVSSVPTLIRPNCQSSAVRRQQEGLPLDRPREPVSDEPGGFGYDATRSPPATATRSADAPGSRNRAARSRLSNASVARHLRARPDAATPRRERSAGVCRHILEDVVQSLGQIPDRLCAIAVCPERITSGLRAPLDYGPIHLRDRRRRLRSLPARSPP